MKPNAHAAASRSLTIEEGNGLSVFTSFAIDGEGGRVAAIDYALFDAVGAILAEGSRQIRSYPDASTYRARIALPVESVREDHVWDAMLELGETVALRWRIELRGEGGERLARKSLWTTYREEDLAPSRPRRRRLKMRNARRVARRRHVRPKARLILVHRAAPR